MSIIEEDGRNKLSGKSWEKPKATISGVMGKSVVYIDPDPKPLPSVAGSTIEEIKKAAEEYTGSSVSYYKIHITNPTTAEAPYFAECNDIIEALGMSFAEGNAFKAIWRRCAARKGLSKRGYVDGLYDAEKVVFFGERMVAMEKSEKNK